MKKEKKNLKQQKKKKDIETIVLISLLIILAIIVGFNRIKTSDFNPINGDFQNYNPVRRLLAGQIPFKDFSVYLGSGHLFLISFFQFIIGNTFTKSLFITNMLTFACFEIFSFVLSILILKDKKRALYSTLFLAVLNLYKPAILSTFANGQFMDALSLGYNPGNSAKLIRMFIIPVTIVALYLIEGWLSKSNNTFIKQHTNLLKKICMAIIAGFTILWSNDGGIATYISVSFVYFLLLIKEYKKDFLKIMGYVLMYIAISLVTLFILVVLITRGHPFSWLTFTFSVSSYQRWYYEVGAYKTNINLLQIDLSFFKTFMIILIIYYFYKLFKEKTQKNTFIYGLLGMFCLSIVLSSYLYQFFSGTIFNSFLFMTILVIIIAYVMKFFQNNILNVQSSKLSKAVVVIASISLIISNGAEILKNNKYHKNELNYVANLDGYIRKDWDIDKTIDKLNEENVFSVYATAINTMTNTFQPTGIDYIIHVLGDEQRIKYLENFRQGNFKYVEDISFSNYWHGWIRSANWFFYRELYKNYKPVFSGDYNTFYEKKSIEDTNNSINELDNIKIFLTKNKDCSYSIDVKSDGTIKNGIVDLKIQYNSNFKSNFFKTLDINHYVTVTDHNQAEIFDSVTNSFNIPNNSEEYYIPITIIDGKGSLTINTYPTENTELEINNMQIMGVYDCFKYIHAVTPKKLEEIENKEYNKIYIENSWDKRNYLKDAKKIRQIQNNVIADVISYQVDGNNIVLEIDGNISDFEYPYYFETID